MSDREPNSFSRNRVLPWALGLAVLAGVAAVGALKLLPPQHAVSGGVLPLPSVAIEELGAAGKIAMRHLGEGAQAEDERAGLLVPAALIMPMSVDWEGGIPATPQAMRIARAEARGDAAMPGSKRLAVAEAGRPAALPPSRPADLAPAAPLQLAQQAAQPLPAQKPPASTGFRIGEVVSAPAGRLVGMVAGAAGAVGAAGSWTVAQAAGLVPRW